MLSTRYGELTDGAFDITVQPLWQAYADYFAGGAASALGPPEPVVEAARARVDFRRLRIAPERITLGAGMAVTLNGIAQGYITDRVAALLRARGWSRVLVDMGEMRALGHPADRAAWSIGIAVPPGLDRAPPSPPRRRRRHRHLGRLCHRLRADGRAHHLFSPRTGRSAGTLRP